MATTQEADRYVVCNADESEPGNFKDRYLMENHPHRLLAGMTICAHAVGAKKGIIYIRGEYQRAASIINNAIREAVNDGSLGSSVCGTDFSFEVSPHMGAGAYICGEETALLESLEGRRGEPRPRPPYPTTHGFRGNPTVVNNVETLCAIPFIALKGAEAYRDLGRGEAAGTKLYSVSGHVKQPGVWELPMGTTLRELIDHAGGIPNDRAFKFAVTGGAAGTFVTESMLDIPLDFAAWEDRISLGSGGVMVADDSISAVSFLFWILHFFENESCGKCTPCRVGTSQAKEIVRRIANGDGQQGDIDRLLQLAELLDRTSFCGLGQSVAWPIETAIQRFRQDFETLGAR